jgi:hypothetical protein
VGIELQRLGREFLSDNPHMQKIDDLPRRQHDNMVCDPAAARSFAR